MTAQRIINCCLRYPRSQSTITTIELMVWKGEASDFVDASGDSACELGGMGVWSGVRCVQPVGGSRARACGVGGSEYSAEFVG